MSTQSIALQNNGRSLSNYRSRTIERQQTLLFYASMFCVFTNAILQNLGFTFNTPGFDRPTLALGLVCLFFLLNNKYIIQKLRGKAYMVVLGFWAFFCALTVYSSVVTKDIVAATNPVTLNLTLQLFIIECFGIVLFALAADRVDDVLDFLLKYTGTMVLLTDLLMFGGIRFYAGEFETYLVGSKFDVTYLHMNFVALLFVRLKHTRLRKQESKLPTPLLATLAVIIVLIGIRVDCNTGMLGALIQIMLVYACDRWPKQVAKWLGSPRTFLAFMLISVLFAFYVTMILNIPIIKHFIVDTLHRSLTLTGRTEIYEAYPSLMQNNWSWGFGYGNAYIICIKQLHYADTQNALLEWILQIGIVATAAMAVQFYVIMIFYRQKASMTNDAPLLVVLYVYLLLGTVEITLNNNFWMIIIVLFMLSCRDQKVKKEEVFKSHYTSRQTKRHNRLLT